MISQLEETIVLNNRVPELISPAKFSERAVEACRSTPRQVWRVFSLAKVKHGPE